MKLTKFFAFALAALAFVGCGGDDTTGEDITPVGAINLAANKTACTIGDTITFTVTDSKSQNVTKVAQVYDPDFSELTNKKYTATEAGTFEFFATCGGETSNTLVIKVLAEMPEVPEDMEPENFTFNHRAILIDHTGLACGNCPNMMDNLHAYALTPMAQHYEEVTCHGGYYASNFGDPAYSTAASILDQFQGNTYGLFSGYPAVVLNFRGTTIGNYQYTYFKQYMDQALNAIIKKDGADVGIAVTVEGDEDNILCAAQIKVAVDGNYCVNAWLLENDIYSPNQSGATSDDHRWYHRALRNVSEEISKTDIKGLEIGELKAGDNYTYATTIGITSTKWKWENMGVLVVVSAKDDKGRVEVVNCAYCPVGEQQPFEYL